MTSRTIAIIVLIAAIGVTASMFLPSPQKTGQQAKQQVREHPTSQTIVQAVKSEPAAGEEESPAPTTREAGETAVDVEKAMAPRVLGQENAPVTIEEYASLTCSHCAHFHKQVFSKIKENYIETGKVRFIYSDFPLNTPARDAAAVARCMPHQRYFKYISFLFDTQADWAYESNYKKYLLQNAKLLGGDAETLQACLDSDKLKLALVSKMQAVGQEHKIQSTPSFVINGTELVRGAQPFEVFKQKIDKLLEESNPTE